MQQIYQNEYLFLFFEKVSKWEYKAKINLFLSNGKTYSPKMLLVRLKDNAYFCSLHLSEIVGMGLLYNILHSKGIERLKRIVGLKTGIYLKIKRFTASASEQMRDAMLFNHHNIDLVIDIGANTGQFAESMIDFGYKGKIVSFEPVGGVVYEELCKRSQKYPQWQVAPRCAIGNRNGKVAVNVCEDSVFSSLLPIQKGYSDYNPKAQIVRTEEVDIFTLDAIIDKYADNNSIILIKIDTQGFEKEVLEGATETLKRVKGIKIEIPLFAIYENVQFKFYDIVDFMKKINFQPYSFNIEGVNLKTGQVNTIDGVFFRNEA